MLMLRSDENKLRSISIGFLRDDGDFQLLATMNNKDELLSEGGFLNACQWLVKIFEKEINEDVVMIEREDAPDYIDFF